MELGEREDPPFTAPIMAYHVPPKMKKLDIKPYDGSEDPVDHIELYEGLMELSAARDEMKCQVFFCDIKRSSSVMVSTTEASFHWLLETIEESIITSFLLSMT